MRTAMTVLLYVCVNDVKDIYFLLYVFVCFLCTKIIQRTSINNDILVKRVKKFNGMGMGFVRDLLLQTISLMRPLGILTL